MMAYRIPETLQPKHQALPDSDPADLLPLHRNHATADYDAMEQPAGNQMVKVKSVPVHYYSPVDLDSRYSEEIAVL